LRIELPHRGDSRNGNVPLARLGRRGRAIPLCPGRSNINGESVDAKAKGVKFGRKPKLTAHQRREARERIRGRGDTTKRRPHLQRQSGDDFTAHDVIRHGP
jgi:hypothetical protein